MSQPKGEVLDLPTLRAAAVLNKASGSCDARAEEKLRTILQAARMNVEVTCVDAGGINAALSHAIGSPVDLLIVIGGDGTIRTAAEECGGTDMLLMPLPGGTVNMLPKALYGKRDWEDALRDTLADPAVRAVSGGEVENFRFFCAGIFGAPSLWAGAREAIREARFAAAIRRAVMAYHRTFSRKLRYAFNEREKGAADAISVICPLISTALQAGDSFLEAAALDPASSAEAFRLALNAVFADWRRDPSVSTAKTKIVRLFSRWSVPAILDGEAVRVSGHAEIKFRDHCFNAVVPGGDQAPEVWP